MAKYLPVVLFALLTLVTSKTLGQEILSNDSIETMTRAKLGNDVIISMIQSHPGNYDTSVDSMILLRQEGVSDKVLAAITAKVPYALERGTAAAPVPVPAAAPAPVSSPLVTTADNYEDLDIGVYYKVRGVWVLIKSETVNWKTGGVLKDMATHGLIKQDVNGNIKGGSSATQLKWPPEFLIKTPDGDEGTDYQLVHLHEHSNDREFRIKTGGVFHASGGPSRDAVNFDQARVAKHIYKINLSENPPQGEYAFLAPGLTNSTASGSRGKAWTFRIGE